MMTASISETRKRTGSAVTVAREEPDEPARILALPTKTETRRPLLFALGFAIGIGTHLLFAVVVRNLYLFLGGLGRPPAGSGRLWLDLLLAVQFALPHSVLLHPATRRRLTRFIPSAFYGCFYCVATCCSLLAVFVLWESDGRVVWAASGAARATVQAAFIGSWIALFYSLSLTGFGYQTGFTPWWRWVRGLSVPKRPFHPRGAYLWLRHPVYLSFAGLIWFNPLMTVDRLLLGVTWTIYIAIGSWLKDRRLVFYLGDVYRSYEAEVPGYVGMPAGPLARIPIPPPPLDDSPTAAAVAGRSSFRKAA